MTAPAEPLPIPDEPITVLLCGGAFDPPHRAHLTLPPLARDAIGADLLLYMPAGKAPLKPGPIASNDDRLAMLRAGLEGEPRVAITTLELERPGDSYTIATLKEIRAERPRATLRLLIGADQARQFHKWRAAKEIIQLAEPAVMLRPPLEGADALLAEMKPHWSEAELQEWGGRLVELPAIEASSTRARQLLAEDPGSPELATLLTPPVRRVIAEKGLYVPDSPA